MQLHWGRDQQKTIRVIKRKSPRFL